MGFFKTVNTMNSEGLHYIKKNDGCKTQMDEIIKETKAWKKG